MREGQQFTHLIYQYFYLRFHFGYYSFEDYLPPVDTFCREFCVGAKPVQAALRRLRDEGYIEMGSGRMTKVRFQQSEQERQSFIVDFFSKRWNAFGDLYTSAGLLFAPLLTEGLRRMNEEELDALGKLAERSGEADLFHFYSAVMQKLENPLAMNFFWEASLFQGIPFARWEYRPTQYSAADVHERMSTLLAGARKRRWNDVHDALIRFRRTDLSRITAYLEEHFGPCPEQEQIPFVWRIYRDRPQIYSTVGSRLLNAIYIGEYLDHSYLPPYGELAEKYGVSVNTIRRAVGILNQLGVLQTINGKGTKIFSLGKRCNLPNFEDKIIRRNLAFYVQSFELVCLTCESVTRAFVKDLEPEEKEKLTGQLEQNMRGGLCDTSLWHVLVSIAKNSRLQVVREFYNKTCDFFLWGYPLKASKEKMPPIDRATAVFTKDMISALKENDADRCAAVIKEMLADKLGMAETYLLAQGLRPEELWLCRSIRFLDIENNHQDMR